MVAGAVSAATAPAKPAEGPLQVVLAGTVHQALFAIDFGDKLGVAVGAGGEVQESADHGVSWKLAKAPTQLSLLGVGVAGDHAVAVGQSGTVLLRGADGQWAAGTSGSKQRLLAVEINSAGRAVTVGAFGTVLVSDDAGKTWRNAAPAWPEFVPDGMEPHMYAAHVAEDGTLTIAGEFGLILRSADAGATWTALNKGDASLFALQLRDDGVGYAVGQSGMILRSADGGATWEQRPSGTDALLLGVHAAADGKVVVTAMRDMLVSRDGGGQFSHVKGGSVNNLWFVDVTQATAGAAVLAVGQAGQIVRVEP
ncbi:photosystem II stability/assembly factor-like protein [Solimonas sp. K1W22B-7]|uniref:WD40/YVTN/BNR-like repeat-containing protein n=1 Tax=Solimonas sp. K1W22B-7 TaxID=2303331 RepID=UPI000E32F600|nr:photosystem II stability/assembly factor-like protein [Solimonas sp. K1W22B-7]AXQ27880.1 photosystem II stability/assembly factor-like protein [Solimonas sp. K1W22B-7]